MELQINQFLILKVHSMINSANENQPGLLNTFCAARVKKLDLISAFALRDFAVFERQFPLNIIHEEPCIEFH